MIDHRLDAGREVRERCYIGRQLLRLPGAIRQELLALPLRIRRPLHGYYRTPTSVIHTTAGPFPSIDHQTPADSYNYEFS
jgi:hypothetical protein